jgi:hypothetical protein
MMSPARIIPSPGGNPDGAGGKAENQLQQWHPPARLPESSRNPVFLSQL